MTQREMANRLGVDPSTVSREFSRTGGRAGYDAKRAHALARKRRKNGKRKTKKLFVDERLRTYVESRIRLFWSPEQVSGRVRQDTGMSVCFETIYAFIYEERPEWKMYLRQQKRKYRRRHGTRKRERAREEAKKRRIDRRPRIIERRERFGDWEGDTILGGERTTGILTHVERKSGYLLADLLLGKTADMVRRKTVRRFANTRAFSVTYDNGSEFSHHELIGQETGATIYFAYPYHSWERGSSENVNGLLRQFFPKKMKFATLSQKDVDRVVERINHRPRKRLGYLTPHEVFVEGRSIAFQSRM